MHKSISESGASASARVDINRCASAIEQASRRWRGGRRVDSPRTRRKVLISTQATLFFFSTVYAFNAIRAQNRFGSEYKATKKHWKDSNPRANTVAAFLLIELVITTILAVLAAGVHVPIVGSSDSAAKKEDRKEDGAPPVAEEQA